MVDGIHAVSAPMGDTHFLEHKRIDPGMADRWKGVLANDFLSERTWQLARGFGYELPATHQAEPTPREDHQRRRRARQSVQGQARTRRTSHRLGEGQGE